MVAAYFGQLPVLKTLLAAGVDVNITDLDGTAALHGAAQEGHGGVVDALLDKGAENDALDNNGVTPLMLAALKGRLLVVKTLLAVRADVNNSDPDGYTALHGAAREGQNEVVRALLRAEADNDAVSNKIGTPLMIAANCGQLPVLKTLLAARANVNIAIRGGTALHEAAIAGHNGVVIALLRGGADKGAIFGHGYTPLLLAATKAHWPVVETLLEAGADPTVRGGVEDKSALDYAAQIGQVRTMKAILSHGADVNDKNEVNAVDVGGYSALHRAAHEDQAGAIDALIKAGANIEMGNRHGHTALAEATLSTKCEAMLALLQHGADMKATGLGPTALHLVCANSVGNTEAAVSLLLRWGADETALDGDGKTPADLVNPKNNAFGSAEILWLDSAIQRHAAVS